MRYGNVDGYYGVLRATPSRTLFSTASWDCAASPLSTALGQDLSSTLLTYHVGCIHQRLCPPAFQPFLRSWRGMSHWQYLLDDHVRYSIGLHEAGHLGFGHCRGTTRSDHFAQRLLDHVEHGGFEANIQVEITRLYCDLKCGLGILDDLQR